MLRSLLPLLIGMSFTAIVVGFLLRARDRQNAIDELFELVRNEAVDFDDESGLVPESSLLDISGFANNAVKIAGKLVSHVDAQGALAASLEKARVPLRAGEYAVVAVCASGVGSLFIGVITDSLVFGAMALALFGFATYKLPHFLIARRQKKLMAQLPDALSLIASSLSAGHTFLRSIQMMCEEAAPPLSEEFSRVVYEVRLGAPLVDALDRMAERVEIADFKWVVQAIRIQQTVGGKLAELLHTLADFIRARDEVRREVDVLTAEGRISAWILAAMPVCLALALQVMSPGYMDPLLHGKGLFALAFSAGAVIMGFVVIQKMVKIEV